MASDPSTWGITSSCSSAISMTTASITEIDLTSIKEQIKKELLEEMKQEGLNLGKSSLKELTEERMTRKIDRILENTDEESTDE